MKFSTAFTSNSAYRSLRNGLSSVYICNWSRAISLIVYYRIDIFKKPELVIGKVRDYSIDCCKIFCICHITYRRDEKGFEYMFFI